MRCYETAHHLPHADCEFPARGGHGRSGESIVFQRQRKLFCKSLAHQAPLTKEAYKQMTITLITGGNKGLGYETARRLIKLGHKVYVGARDPKLGQKAADELGGKFVQVDVTDNASVQAAAAQIHKLEGYLDVLINNAGIIGGMFKTEEVTAENMLLTFDTNVFGIVRMTQAFLPLLRKSKNPVVVNVSSGLGSFGMVTNPKTSEHTVQALPYTSSKSAVTMLAVQYAKALPDIRFNAVDPGYTATDLNHHSGHRQRWTHGDLHQSRGDDALVGCRRFR
jgi:NAD(P)-dependent dehydrogenase (short-subunit alcohol dehydrogenase family)